MNKGSYFRNLRSNRAELLFEFVRDFVIVLLTCKNEEDRIKNEGARVLTRVYIFFSYAQGQLTPQSVVQSR